MSRSLRKGPFIDVHLLEKVKATGAAGKGKTGMDWPCSSCFAWIIWRH